MFEKPVDVKLSMQPVLDVLDLSPSPAIIHLH